MIYKNRRGKHTQPKQEDKYTITLDIIKINTPGVHTQML
jgi:hypothetical protein